MMSVTRCKQCGKAGVDFDKVFVTVSYTKNVICCEKCNRVSTETESKHFCSEICFEAYYIHDAARAEPKKKMTPLEEWNTAI